MREKKGCVESHLWWEISKAWGGGDDDFGVALKGCIVMLLDV